MTCVLPVSSWNHFNDPISWYSMGSDSSSSQPLLEKSQSQGYVSPGSESRKSYGSSGKKRASRAGTRSVSTLSAAQLERKRANDREAQRAIRQRTKDHIDYLERSINELRGHHEQAQQRNRALEEENAFLRGKLNESGYNVDLLTAESQRQSEPPLLSLATTSPVSAVGSGIPRPGSTSTPSPHSAVTQPSGSRHTSWQHQPAGFATALPGTSAVAHTPNLTTWRSHESLSSAHTQPNGSLQDSMHPQSSTSFDWPHGATSYQQFASQESQRGIKYETAPAQQTGYQQASIQAYGTSAPSPPPTFHAQMTPQSDFPTISVSSSPSSYQIPSQATFQQSATFGATSMQVPSSGIDYTSSTTQMQPPPLPSTSFHSAHGREPGFGSGQAPPAIQYRDNTPTRPYSLSHYGTA